jgi:putative hydrolase of the HAD superfamily
MSRGEPELELELEGTVVLWDFDGTLAERPGLWSACMLEALEPVWPGNGLEAGEFDQHLRAGFPWHDTTVDRRHLTEPDDWWRALHDVLRAAYLGVGVPDTLVESAVAQVRPTFNDASGWRLIEGAADALAALKASGARQAVLSNHVPELPLIVDALGIGGYFERVFTSAAIGWEKPHPEIFAYALAELGHPSDAWLVGDNPVADVQGATAAGIGAVLVNGSYLRNGGVTHAEAVDIIRAGARADRLERELPQGG